MNSGLVKPFASRAWKDTANRAVPFFDLLWYSFVIRRRGHGGLRYPVAASAPIHPRPGSLHAKLARFEMKATIDGCPILHTCSLLRPHDWPSKRSDSPLDGSKHRRLQRCFPFLSAYVGNSPLRHREIQV